MLDKEIVVKQTKYTCKKLLQELQANEPLDYKNHLRMDEGCFDVLLSMVKPHIEKQSTATREAIPANQRLG